MSNEDFEKFLFPLSEEQVAIVKECNYFLLGLSGFSRQRKFGVPFYKRKDDVCYLNPNHKGGIEVSFPKGYTFKENKALLDFGSRKNVGSFVLNNFSEISQSNFHNLILEAIRKDNEFVNTPMPYIESENSPSFLDQIKEKKQN